MRPAARVPRPHFTLIVVTSRDGYIVPGDGASPDTWASSEEQLHFRGLVAGLDWAFMGRRTHELAWRPNRRRVVFSTALAGPEWRHPLHLWADPGRVSLAAMLARARRSIRPGAAASWAAWRCTTGSPPMASSTPSSSPSSRSPSPPACRSSPGHGAWRPVAR
ncbi:MAG: hypothetical protein R3D25_02460 [Geminicoccaceae bacterium]